MSLIQRESFEWGVQLTARPFEGDAALGSMAIHSDIMLPKPNRGCITKITWSPATITSPLKPVDAQAWQNALAAILQETRTVVAEMKAAQAS